MSPCLAAVFDGTAGRIELRELAIPTPHASEVLVRVLGCTLCGSDLHSFEGRRRVPVPTILGHEIVGKIVAFGDAAPSTDLTGKQLRLGQRVTWAIVANCHECTFCQRRLPQKCLNGTKYGHQSFGTGHDLSGGLAEYCLLVRGTSIVVLPDELPLEVACPANCATATIAAALEAAGDLKGRSVCLSGAGMLGLTACAMARALGAAEVIAIDPILLRRTRALEFGATHVASPEQFADVAMSTVGNLGYDVMVELSGSKDAFQLIWPRIRIGGILVLVGSVFPGPPVELFLEQVVRRQLTIKGIHNYAPRHLVKAVEFLAGHHDRIPFADLVAQWLPLTSITDAFHLGRQQDVIRVGICPDDAP